MKAYRLVIFLASLSFISVAVIQHAEAQCRINEAAKVTASDAAALDLFGESVSISGDVAIVAARGNDDACPELPFCSSGSAYMYRLDEGTWVEAQKLTASDAAAGDLFGSSVSVSGDVVVVGAYLANCPGEQNCGAAYVYRLEGTTWVEEQVLTASDAAPNDIFGVSVAVGGNVAVVGAQWTDDAGTNSGSAYVYCFNGSSWIEEQKLIASDAAAEDFFGSGVSVSGDVTVVAAPKDDDAGASSGSAYVYRFNGSMWVEEQKLTASDAAVADWFGTSVSVSGNVVVVGASLNNNPTDSGSAYVYRFNGNTWIEEQKLIASDAAAADYFGTSVSVSGELAVVGARGDDDAGSLSGSAYVYEYDGNTWVEKRKLTVSDGAMNLWFGASVSVSGYVAAVGAKLSDDACRQDPECNSGAAYLFGINPIPSDPPCGAIDARQPSAPDGSDPAGWDSITMTFDDPPGEMNADDFAVVISPPGDAPTVTDVTTDGNTATVHFDDFIPTEAWTTITHWPSGAVTRIGYLPADVNNDKISNANDVLFLIDVLNGVIDPAPPVYQTDTDRSGATNANDVLRVIDLLNGAGVYDEHLDAELPA